MNLNNLTTFLSIVETGSLVKASKQLHVTQSTVTARLHNLEDELGQVLLRRQKSGILLTPAGERLRRYATTMTDLWQQAKLETSLPEGITGVCNIGCQADLWSGLGKPVFDSLRKNHPEVAVSVWLGNQRDLENWISTGLTDLNLSYWTVAQGNTSSRSLGNDKLVFVSTDQTSGANLGNDYVFVDAGEEFARQHAAHFSKLGSVKFSFGNASLGLEHILDCGGSAYLPLRLIKGHLEVKTLFQIEGMPSFDRKVHLIMNDNILEQQTLLEFIENDARKILASEC